MPHGQIDALQLRVREEWRSALESELAKLGAIAPMTITVGKGGSAQAHGMPLYRAAPGSITVSLQGIVPAPSSARATYAYAVLTPKATSELEAAFGLFLGGEHVADTMLREVYPEVSGALKFRFSTLARTQLLQLLGRLRDGAITTMKKDGYA